MAYIFQSKDKNGKTHSKYRFQYTDYKGNRRTGTGTNSKRETKEIAEKVELKHKMIRSGLVDAPKSKTNYSFNEKLSEYIDWGMHQGGRQGKPWSERHTEMRKRHLNWWKTQLNCSNLKDIEKMLPNAERALRKLHKGGKSGKTISNYAEALKSFTNYCKDREYVSTNPFLKMAKFDTSTVSKRRILSQDEIRKLLAIADYPYQILYEVAICTGLRANELRSLTVDDLDEENSGLILHSKWTKNRKDGFQPIPKYLITKLKGFIASGVAIKMYELHYSPNSPLKFPSNPLLHVPTHPVHQLNKYLEKANIPKHTKDGTLVFHSFRNNYITLVCGTGTDLKTTQTLARHSDPNLTMNVYARANNDTMRTIAEQVGSIISTQQKREPSENDSLSNTYEVAGPGLEPGTQGFSVLCSTN